MIKHIILLALIISMGMVLPYPALAQSASPSATPSTMQQKIEALKKEIASKAAALKQDVNKKMQNKVYSGKVLEKTDEKITISTSKGNKIIIINEYTSYQDLNSPKTKITLKNIAKDNWVAGLGDVDDSNNLVAKKLVKIKEPVVKKHEFALGIVEKVYGNSIYTKLGKENTTFLMSASAKYLLGNEEASFADVKTGRTVIIRWDQMNEQYRNGDFVYILPAAGFLKPEKSSSPSATPSASPKK